MDLRRRVGIRDWILAIVVVSATQLLPGISMGIEAFISLFVLATTMTLVWIFVSPRLPEARALWLEQASNAISSLGLLGLVAASGGPESPYIYFYALTIIFVAAFIESTRMRVVLIGLGGLCALAPIAYDWQLAREDNFIPMIVVSLAFWISAAVLIALKRDSAIAAEFAARRAAYVDPMTGAATRRALEEFVDRLEQDGIEYTAISIRAVGVDQINRSGGHIAGDVALVRVVAAMRAASLDVDQVARLGGVEFAAVLPGAGMACAENWIARFHERLMLEGARADDAVELVAAAGAARAESLDAALALAAESVQAVGGLSARERAAASSTDERAEHLRAQLERVKRARSSSKIESIEAPSNSIFAVISALLVSVLIATTGGATSVFLSAAILQVAYFACFGERKETIVTMATMGIGVVAAVVWAGPLTSVDQTRTFSIVVTMLLLADSVQRNVRSLRLAELRTAELSLIDEQTGLGNRTAFERTLSRMLLPGAETARLNRFEGMPAVVSIELITPPGTRELIAASSILRDAAGGDAEVYRVGVGDFAIVTRAHHEQHLAELVERSHRAMLDGATLGATGMVTSPLRCGGAIHDGSMDVAEFAAAAVVGNPQSVLLPEQQYAFN